MNRNWKDFLIAEQARFINETSVKFDSRGEAGKNHLYALAHLSVLTVSGQDAAQFLQGQITCNIHDITESRASLGAFCNAKGRAITTFLLVKLQDTLALIFPSELSEIVRKKLQMYILRADVTLTDSSDHFCLIGLSVPGECEYLDLPKLELETHHTDGCLVKLPAHPSRYLMISDPQTAINQWSRLTEQALFQPQSSDDWRYLDMLAGMPWLTPETTEEFIPQMLNLDKLGGISFNKGCYTGQEIIARTHYLGKSKRELFLAESDSAPPPLPNTSITDQDGQPVGKVLQALKSISGCKMLIVLPTALSESEALTLDNKAKNKVRVITL